MHGPIVVCDVYDNPLVDGFLKVYREGRVDAIGHICRETAFGIQTYSNRFSVAMSIA
jgi:hypothetical protein